MNNEQLIQYLIDHKIKVRALNSNGLIVKGIITDSTNMSVCIEYTEGSSWVWLTNVKEILWPSELQKALYSSVNPFS